MRSFLPRPPLPLRKRYEDKGIYSYQGGKSPDDASYPPGTAYPIESAQDRSKHTESAAAYQSRKTEQVCCHPQTPPWSESSTADGLVLPLSPVVGETICTLRLLRNP